MAVLVGIDEAGLGPLLGPLVVSSTAFSIPHHLLQADLWHILRKSVGSSRKRLAGRLLIADSKKAYNKSLGIKQLQRTVLAFLACLDRRCVTLTDLLTLLCPDSAARLNGYPWYQDAGSYPLVTDEADIGITSAVLRDDLEASALKVLALRSECLDVAHYNQMVAAVKNKANVLFTYVCRLIKTAYDSFSDDDLQIVIDRLGGRVRYRKALQRMFPAAQLKVVSEGPSRSSYELKTDHKQMRLHFVVGADRRFLPVSLASMVSKYLRELLIANINCYFSSLVENLKPTAGYWKDGLRFVEDLKKSIPHRRFDMDQLVRCR